jgi:hypothetical protein
MRIEQDRLKSEVGILHSVFCSVFRLPISEPDAAQETGGEGCGGGQEGRQGHSEEHYVVFQEIATVGWWQMAFIGQCCIAGVHSRRLIIASVYIF